ncbi:MAG: hypothetical protein AB1801_21965 [Chloroflexota bacterium]
MVEIEYLTDKHGRPKAVVIPVELWRQILLKEDVLAELAEEIEDYCLSQAMDEAKESPLMTREEALAYLGE